MAKRRPVLLASVFAAIALLALVIGLLVPKKYTASTSILVEHGNIIEPLMEGRAVSTSVANRAMMARVKWQALAIIIIAVMLAVAN